jgi:hypothetical protein
LELDLAVLISICYPADSVKGGGVGSMDLVGDKDAYIVVETLAIMRR